MDRVRVLASKPGLGSRRTLLLQLAASILVILTPIIMFSHPALTDYQNHLARIWIISSGTAHADATPFFRTDWLHINNDLGVDAVAHLFRGRLTAEWIGRLCLTAAVLLPTAGTIALNARIFGASSSYLTILPFFAWSLTAVAGFLNFQIGLGLALLFVAIDPLFKSRPWVPLIGRTLCATILFLDHALALAFYAMLLAGSSFGAEGLKASTDPVRQRLLRAALAAATCVIPIILLTIITGTAPGNRELPGAHAGYTWNGPLQLLQAITSPLSTYNIAVDGVIGLLLLSTIGYAAYNGKIRLHTGLFTVALLLVFAEMFVPSGTPQGGWTDRRLPIMALLTALSSIQVTFPGRKRAEAIFSLLAFLLIIVRTSWIGWNWQGAEQLSDSVSEVLADVPAGATILPLQHEPTTAEINAAPRGRFIFRRDPSYRHLPTLAISERRAFVPTLFAQAGVHPVAVNQPWRDIAFPEGGELASVAALRANTPAPINAPYVQHWRTRFDYVLVLNADYPDKFGGEVLPPELKLVKHTGFAALYKIEKSPVAGSVTAASAQP